MPSLTLSVPEEMLVRMKEHAEIKWSEIARQAIGEMLEQLDKSPRVIRVRGMPIRIGRLSERKYERIPGVRAPLKELGLE